MNSEKRLALWLSAGLGILLLICTAASQIIWQRLLPQVRIVEGAWSEEGFSLPGDVLFACPQGDCVYYIEEKPGRFGSRYLVRQAFVTVLDQDANANTVTVRGIYNPDWVFAAGADLTLSDGMEVLTDQKGVSP